MFVIALTGGIGSGKSEAAKVFAELGVPVTDVDVIAHQLTAANQPLVAVIKANFGDAYITPEGALNRAAMRALVFGDDAARAKLNAILHPAIYDETVKRLQANQIHINNNVQYQLLVIPLLFENPRYLSLINRVLLIDCDEATQIARVKQRSQLPEAEILQIMKAQTLREKRLSLADDIIKNDKNVTNLHKNIEQIHQKYLNTCIVSKTT
jgi:dephospho-CoA kinase